MHGKSHTRVPGVSIMRDNCRELQVSAIPLSAGFRSFLASQAHAHHQTVYQKLSDCAVETFHVSITAAPSLLQDEVQIFNAEKCKKLIGPDGGSVLRVYIAYLFDHCSVISLQTLKVWFVNCQASLAWSIALRTKKRPRFLKER